MKTETTPGKIETNLSQPRKLDIYTLAKKNKKTKSCSETLKVIIQDKSALNTTNIQILSLRVLKMEALIITSNF